MRPTIITICQSSYFLNSSLFNNNTTVFLFLHMNTDAVMFVAHMSMKADSLICNANIGGNISVDCVVQPFKVVFYE